MRVSRKGDASLFLPQERGSVPFSVEQTLAQLIPGWPDARLCVALSGGVDSVALLRICHEFRETWPILRLRAVHVHHGLQQGADEWQARCQALCARLDVPFEAVTLNLVPGPGESLEAQAREARYRKLAALLEPGEALLTAHHQDDQFETVLLQLFRGAGVSGLAAMPPLAPLGRGLHLRPMLQVARSAIEAYAREMGLDWVEDPMNAAARYSRGYLRREVTPVLRARWPAVARCVGRSASHLADARSLLDELAGIDAAVALDGKCLRVEALVALPRPRQTNLLRWWLRQRGLGLPSTARLAAILDDLLPARADAQPVVSWASGEVRRHRGRLYAMLPLGSVPEGPWMLAPGQGISIEGIGTVTLVPGTGRGLRAGHGAQPFEMRLWRGGERLRPAGHAFKKSVNRLFQESGTEPWLRNRIPLIYSGEQLLAIGDTWLAAESVAAPGEASVEVHWARQET